MPLADAIRPRTLDEVCGQKHLLAKGAPLRRIIESGHVPSLIFYGPPGTGKTMLARCLPGLLPEMTLEESLETTRIHSAAGLLPPGAGLLTSRPFRAPHHSASLAALVGGGRDAHPGEITLAHNGVLRYCVTRCA